MAESGGYVSHLSLEAVAFVTALPKRKQLVALDIAEQLASQPHQHGDYRMNDDTGRMIENTLVDGFLFSYWVDHAAREIRISEIIQV